MDNIIDITYRDVLSSLKNKEYVLADTRVPFITLYDHLILTSGIAVAITRELLVRGKSQKRSVGWI